MKESFRITPVLDMRCRRKLKRIRRKTLVAPIREILQ